MSKFMIIHNLPKGTTREQVDQVTKAAQHDQSVKGYRSFINISEGKAVCVYEAETKDAVASWFEKNHMPFESITQLEIEEDHGMVRNV